MPKYGPRGISWRFWSADSLKMDCDWHWHHPFILTLCFEASALEFVASSQKLPYLDEKVQMYPLTMPHFGSYAVFLYVL